jgi:ligand-binding SRPBCC domain-containing protein
VGARATFEEHNDGTLGRDRVRYEVPDGRSSTGSASGATSTGSLAFRCDAMARLHGLSQRSRA